jgi:hypothetical protein
MVVLKVSWCGIRRADAGPALAELPGPPPWTSVNFAT